MAEAGKRGTRGKKAAAIPDPDLFEEVTESKAVQGKKVKEPPKSQQEFENGVHTMPKKGRGKKAPAAAASEESGKSEAESSAEEADSDYKEEKAPKKGPAGKKAAPKKAATAGPPAKKTAEADVDMEMPAPTNGFADKKTAAKGRAASKTKVPEAEQPTSEDAMNGDHDLPEPEAPAKRGGRGKKDASPPKKLKMAKAEEPATNGGGDASVDEEAPKRGGRGKKAAASAGPPMDEPKAMKAGRGKK